MASPSAQPMKNYVQTQRHLIKVAVRMDRDQKMKITHNHARHRERRPNVVRHRDGRYLLSERNFWMMPRGAWILTIVLSSSTRTVHMAENAWRLNPQPSDPKSDEILKQSISSLATIVGDAAKRTNCLF
jgi:hypothetical protein